MEAILRADRRRRCVIASLLLLLLQLRRMSRTPRRYGVRPFLLRNRIHSQYLTLVQYMLKYDSDEFFSYVRMTPNMFYSLLHLVKDELTCSLNRADVIPPEMKLILTLHYLATGISQRTLARSYVIGRSTCNQIIRNTCEVLWAKLMPTYLPQLNSQSLESVAKEFYNKWNIPNCIGALDGKHVVIKAPKHSGTDYFSYKKSFSLILMATCDAYYKFKMVDIGAQGSAHDSSVFKQSYFGQAFLNEQLDFPNRKFLPNTSILFPYYVVADQAFPLHNRIMRPFPGEGLKEGEKIYNYRISRARRTIENSFGILAQRWRILMGPINGDVTTCENIVKTCVVLHNFLQVSEENLPVSERRYCPTGMVDEERPDGTVILGSWRQDRLLRSVGRIGTNNSSRDSQRNRNTLCDYFNSAAGSLEFQWELILRGSVPLGF